MKNILKIILIIYSLLVLVIFAFTKIFLDLLQTPSKLLIIPGIINHTNYFFALLLKFLFKKLSFINMYDINILFLYIVFFISSLFLIKYHILKEPESKLKN